MSWREAFGVAENQNLIPPKSVPQMPEPRPRGNSGICGTGFRGIKNSNTAWGVFSNPTPKARKPAPEQDSWRAKDWKAYYVERAAIRQYDAGMSRREAELRAIEDTIAEWLRRRPIDAEPSACAWCHKQDIGQHDIRVVEYRSGGNLWAHASCWSALRATWTYEADMALHAMGVHEGA